ncbi:MAG TPA: hypothetical protein VF273_09565 [Pelobium sp.]
MNVIDIQDEAHYRKALKRLNEIFDGKIGTPEIDELDMLGLLIYDYDTKHYPTRKTNFNIEC